MAIKHYFGKFRGRIACCRDWLHGGHYYTANATLQRKIEAHPYFAAGRIEVIEDAPEAPDDNSTSVESTPASPNWEAHIRGLNWNELRDLAKDRGIALFGKKAVHLIEELIELGG